MSEPILVQVAPHRQRVIDEKAALDEKILKLEAFTRTQTFAAISFVERNALQNQLGVMRQYSGILLGRISRF